MPTKIKPEVKDSMERHKAYFTVTYRNPISDEELLIKQSMIPKDTRDFTGRLMGDPIPGDNRRR